MFGIKTRPPLDRTEPGQAPALPARMQAVVQDGYGGPEVLRLQSVPLPQVTDDEVLVEVHAAGLARGTWHVMTGTPYLLRLFVGLHSPRRPVAGLNLAGVVVTAGKKATRFKPGDRVYGIGKGSFAGYAAAPEHKLAPMPAGLDFEQAASVPVSGLTALQAVTDVAKVSSGQRVLVTGASGGVGSLAVQLAVAAGADVTGVCSAAKAGFVRDLGAHLVLDYRSKDYAESEDTYDAVIDIAGNPSLARLRRALKPGGTAALVGGEEGGRLTGGMIERQITGGLLSVLDRDHRRFRTVLAKESGAELERLGGLLESGAVVPRIDSRFPLAEAPAAMNRLVSGEMEGSVILTVPRD
ncbi:MAG: NAD(P)-dependent alcohol dehydrogenase [Arthrobacter sp.]